MSYLTDWLKVTVRDGDPRAEQFEVAPEADGEWTVRVRKEGKRVDEATEGYSTKYNAKRAAYRRAAPITGAKVRVLPRLRPDC